MLSSRIASLVGRRAALALRPQLGSITTASSLRLYSAQPEEAPSADIPILQTTKPSPRLSNLQQECWDSYLSSGRGCLTLFSLIDTDHTNSITYKEINDFLENVNSRGINEAAKKEIWDAAEDHLVTFPEFQAWLIRATMFDECGRNAKVRAMYDTHPHLGPRYQPKKEVEEYSWNVNTMSQGLRRMQYAVRGEVVMRADALAAEGKEIVSSISSNNSCDFALL